MGKFGKVDAASKEVMPKLGGAGKRLAIPSVVWDPLQ